MLIVIGWYTEARLATSSYRIHIDPLKLHSKPSHCRSNRSEQKVLLHHSDAKILGRSSIILHGEVVTEHQLSDRKFQKNLSYNLYCYDLSYCVNDSAYLVAHDEQFVRQDCIFLTNFRTHSA